MFILAAAGGSQRRVNNGAISSLDALRRVLGVPARARHPDHGDEPRPRRRRAVHQHRRAGRRRVARSQRGRPLHARHSRRALLQRTARSCLRYGRRVSRPPRAWVGFYCYMLREHVVIAGVLPGTPGERGGLRARRRRPVGRRRRRSACAATSTARLWEHKPGDVIRFQVFRDNAVRRGAGRRRRRRSSSSHEVSPQRRGDAEIGLETGVQSPRLRRLRGENS